MNFQRLLAPVSVHTRRWTAASLISLVALVIVACGGGGTTPDNRASALRPLSAEFSSRKAVAYSPYRTAANEAGLAAEVIPEANIKQDLDLLVQGGFGLIRLFDSDDKVGKATLAVIRKYNLNLKVQLGVYVQSGNDFYNQAQLDRAVVLANTYRDIVLAVSVGNETMVVWSFNKIDPSVMAGYLRKIRTQITQPITTDDNYDFWAKTDARVTDAIDFASLHTYTELDTVFVPEPGLFDWRQKGVPEAQRAAAMMDASVAEARRQYDLARNNLDRLGRADIPITIGETGWNAVDLGTLKYRAHPVNQKMYYDRLATWATEGRTGAGPKAIFYFEAFDEPWKQGDDKWGLFNKDRKARYVVKDLYPSSMWEAGTAALTAADAVYWKLTPVAPAVTTAKYKVYAEDGVPAATVSNSCNMDPARWRLDAFDGSTATWAEISSTSAPGDATHSCEITPNPKDYGWGMLYQAPTGLPFGSTVNLGDFAATGKLNVSIKTTYPGKIEIGVSTDTAESGGQEAFLQIGNGDYGYCNTGAWCQVSIPLKDFMAANSKLDFQRVILQFVISDVYSRTGKSANSNIRTPIDFDALYYTK